MDLLTSWLRNDLLPAAAIVVGGALLVRVARWIEGRYRIGMDEQLAAVRDDADHASEQLKRSRAVVEALGWCARVVIVSITLAYALNVLGVPLGTLIAPATVAGVAIGFGAQQVVGDLLAGFFLLAERQFGYGDVVRFSQPGAQDGITGTVEELTLRVTKLRTADGNQVIIPNGALKQVTNLSKEWSRAVVDVPVSSDENLDRAGGIVEQAALAVAADEGWADLFLSAPVVTGVESVEVGFIRLRVVARTRPGRQFEVARELRMRIASALKDAGVATLAADVFLGPQ